MAPDKIFIDEDLIAFHILQTRYEGDVEYIRKDALLEWAKGWKDKLDDSLGASMVHHVLNEVIKKIESL